MKLIWICRQHNGGHFTAASMCNENYTYSNFLDAMIWKLFDWWHRLFMSLWWRHQMETFSALLAICAGNSPVSGEFPAQRPETRSCDVFFDLPLDGRLSKHSWGWWLEPPSCPFWRQGNDPHFKPFRTNRSFHWRYFFFTKIHIQRNYGFAFNLIWQSDRCKILNIARQLCCRVKCKQLSWSDI